MARDDIEAELFADSDQLAALRDAHIASDGWVSMPHPGGEGTLHLRLQRADDDRFVVNAVYLEGPRMTYDVLRSVQPARLEALFEYFRAKQADANAAGTSALTAEVLAADCVSVGRSDDNLTLGELRERGKKGTQTFSYGGPGQDINRPLGRPDGTDPETFYRRVALKYRFTAARSRHPAVVMAEEANVPVNTVRTWIKEARRRKFLPAGERGKAG